MAGGIFPGRPFIPNIKCVLFTLVLAGGYWFLPAKNLLVLFFLLWFPYIALAWYDYSYKCQDKLKPTVIPFGRYIWLPFKPQGYKEAFKRLPVETIRTMDHVDAWTLVFIVIAVIFLNLKK
jgi:hypothetical protein